jgi:hypothetical protein
MLMVAIVLLALNVLLTVQRPVQAAAGRQYRAWELKLTEGGVDAASLQSLLNQQAQNGWTLHSMNGSFVILDK